MSIRRALVGSAMTVTAVLGSIAVPAQRHVRRSGVGVGLVSVRLGKQG